MGQVKRWKCSGCDEIVLDEHPINKNMWVRSDNKQPAQSPAGVCYLCGYEYSFFSDGAPQDREGIFLEEREIVHPALDRVQRRSQGNLPDTLNDPRFGDRTMPGEDSKEVLPPSQKNSEQIAEDEAFARQKELERKAFDGDPEAIKQLKAEEAFMHETQVIEKPQAKKKPAKKKAAPKKNAPVKAKSFADASGDIELNEDDLEDVF